MKDPISRRESLLRCASLGALRLAPLLGLNESVEALQAREWSAARRSTQSNEFGPFYKREVPNRTALRVASDPGLPLAVSGAVFGSGGEALPGAKIEIWQADHHGLYDLDGYRFRAALIAGPKGRYHFQSALPGHYPARVCQHVHYLVTGPAHRPLITQLYFATDPVFEGDPERNYTRDPLILSRELVQPVTLSGDPAPMQAEVTFELVLERL